MSDPTTAKGWRWMEGAADTNGNRVTSADWGGVHGWVDRKDYHYDDVKWDEDAKPDREDPATAGCLLALVREAHADPRLYVMLSNDGRALVVPGRQSIAALAGKDFASEWDALTAALHAAPVRA